MLHRDGNRSNSSHDRELNFKEVWRKSWCLIRKCV